MGERLLLGLRHRDMEHPIWLYNHWLGVREYFFEMIATIYVQGKFYKRRSKALNPTEWLIGILEYDEGTVVTSRHDDHNYLAAILIDYKAVTIVWVPLYSYVLTDDQMDKLYEEFTDIMESNKGIEEIREELIGLVKRVPAHEIFTLKKPTDIIKIINHSIEAYEKSLESLKQKFGEYANTIDYTSRMIKSITYSINRLEEFAAEITAAQLQ